MPSQNIGGKALQFWFSKALFNATFEGQNKSAIVAELMREAVERVNSKQRSHEAYARILESR